MSEMLELPIVVPSIKVKCLIVDDLEENLLALSALLSADDVELLCARSGAEALDLLLGHDDVALALLDVQMPDMDGFELAELMRGSTRTRHVPIIFVTAGTHDQRRMFKGYDTGAVDFLYKPIEPHILRSKAGVFFELYRQRKRLTDDLRERTETLRLNEMFTAVLSHDLRNPLGAILTGAQLLEKRADDELVRATSGRIVTSAKRMARLIEDMLDLARARLAGGIPLKREPTHLGILVEGVLQEHRSAFSDRWVETEQQGDLRGEWDPERLAQAVSNLIGNALTHGDPREAVRVTIDGSAPHAVSLLVGNAGAIAPDLVDHIFDPFRSGVRSLQRLEAGGARRQGLGLGLYIVQQIVLAHQGTIALEPVNVSRTIFRVEIPRREQPTA